MRRSSALVLSGLALVGAAAGAIGCGSGDTVAPEEVARGHELFKATCASCHGQNAEGMPRLGKDLHANAFVESMTEEELVAFFKEGRPAFHPDNERGVDMPPKGGNPALQDEDLRLIAVYVRSIQ